MIAIDQLRYVRQGTRDLQVAADFALNILGLQLVDRSDNAAYFRSDLRDHTLVFFLGEPTDQAVGFEIHGRAQFEAAVAGLSQHGIDVKIGTELECAARRVRALARFRDPGDVPACESLWTTLFNGRVSDWVGDAVFLRFDQTHHRVAYYPSTGNGILAIEFAVENVDLLMQNSYFLQSSQIRIVHGPGRRPTSNQLFLTFAGPDETLFSFVAEGDHIADEARHRPRQFPRTRSSFCAWGSESEIPEFR